MRPRTWRQSIAAQNGHLEVVRLLRKAGAEKDRVNVDGATALVIAAQSGHLELLLFGADSDLGQPDGATPLLIAAQNGHTEVARLLQ